MGWKYHAGLCLIVIVVIIWVASAEITQRIFLEYKQPFAFTYLGISLMVIYLPLAAIKGWIRRQLPPNSSRSYISYLSQKSNSVTINDAGPTLEADLRAHLIIDVDISEREEGRPLIDENHAHVQRSVLECRQELSKWEIAKYSLCLTPMWFLSEYMSNSALANTSVASTTVLTSTTGLFTLVFGALLGQENINTAKVVAVFISMAGVFMTTLGETWAPDDKLGRPDSSRRHTITGDVYCLVSALFYGLFTVLLKKFSGTKGDKVDVQILFGYIGLFTLLGLWWLAWPLHALGVNTSFKLPQSSSTTEMVLLNAFVGSVMSDYFWALSVIWTTPLVATLGVSLNMPLAMLADMFFHGRQYSFLYTVGCIQVFAGFLIANLSDRFKLKVFES